MRSSAEFFRPRVYDHAPVDKAPRNAEAAQLAWARSDNLTGRTRPDQGPFVPGALTAMLCPPSMPLPGASFPPFPQFQPQSLPGTPFTPPPQFPQPMALPFVQPMYPPSSEYLIPSIATREIDEWACRGLRTFEMRLSEGQYEFVVFESYLVDHYPNLESVLIQYPSVRFGQNDMRLQTTTRVPGQMQLQAQNELLPWRGLTRMRSFEIAVNWIGHLGAKDFAFLASRESDGTLGAKSCSSGPSVSKIKDVYWPKQEEFVLALDPLHLGGLGGRGRQTGRCPAPLKRSDAASFGKVAVTGYFRVWLRRSGLSGRYHVSFACVSKEAYLFSMVAQTKKKSTRRDRKREQTEESGPMAH